MNTILIWILAIIASGLFVYFVPYRNIKIIQKLQKEGLQKLDTIINLLSKKKLVLIEKTIFINIWIRYYFGH